MEFKSISLCVYISSVVLKVLSYWNLNIYDIYTDDDSIGLKVLSYWNLNLEKLGIAYDKGGGLKYYHIGI